MKNIARIVSFLVAIAALHIFGIEIQKKEVDAEGKVSSEDNNKVIILGILNAIDFSSMLGSHPDFEDILMCGIAELISVLTILYILYGILSVLGVDKDNKSARKSKALYGYMGISILVLLAEYL